MQVTVEDVSSVKKILHIEIPEKQITSELDKAYNDLKKNAKIKGFRPGKAPRSVLERQFGKDVKADVTSKLIQGTFVEALKETDLKVVGTPLIDPPDLIPSGPYKYQATVDINPEIADIDFKGLKLKKTIYPPDDAMVEVQLKMLQKNMAELTPVAADRAAQPVDFVLINYEGFKDGKPFSAMQKTENFTMKLGDGKVAKEVDDGIVGMKPGESKEIPVMFPEDHANVELAEQEIIFQVILNEIREEVLPPLDDELAKRMGPFGSLEDLKNSIRGNLSSGYAKRTEQELNEQIFSNLIEKTRFEVPDSLIDYELDHIISDTQRAFAQKNISMQDVGLTRETMTGKYRDVAEKQARRHLILTKIVDQEKLLVTDEETDTAIREMAAAYQQPFEEIKKYFMAQQEGLLFFKETLLEKKAIQLIINSSVIEEVIPTEPAQKGEQ
ncbi:MAG: trigger factor [Pseudomonadota bacterium]